MAFAGYYEDASDDTFGTTAPVDSFPEGASPFGALNMAGNVIEWTSSPRCSYLKPDECDKTVRIVRGGCWGANSPKDVSTSYRLPQDPRRAYANFGIRCARDAAR